MTKNEGNNGMLITNFIGSIFYCNAHSNVNNIIEKTKYRQFSIILSAPLVLENWLPCGFKYQLVPEGKQLKNNQTIAGDIATGEVVTLYNLDPNLDWKLCTKLAR